MEIVGRFAPSPSGRMHLGNIYTSLLSWLSVKARGGRWILRIEDLDPQRSKPEYALMIEEDLRWLGLEWDEGGLWGKGPNGPYVQSQRHHLYEEALERLKATGLCYPCTCTRADILATQAPHESDGRVVYKGTCRPPHLQYYPDATQRLQTSVPCLPGAAVRLMVPDEEIVFTDRIKGYQSVNLAQHCGDFIVRRGDGAWAYQLAVVVDDALMGVTEVMRGDDLLLSAAQQIYLYRLLGYTPPEFAHIPLVCNDAGIRLSKRDKSLSMEYLRANNTPKEVLGMAAYRAKIIDEIKAVELAELLELCAAHGKGDCNRSSISSAVS